ncbi:MAG: thiol:disulfide interchange protein DsbA/DsbL [Betaproteobacteria bacterium]|nr:thiol:disulfide interchange protein DsbA/DsbL [Betaproteobacteria bacterium]
MNRRSVFSTLFGVLLAVSGLNVAHAQGAPVAGKDYLMVKTPQPTDSSGKIEVLEFFSYACPHCYDFEPYLESWAKTLPKDVVFRRIPVSFGREAWAALGRIYYALDVLGVAEKKSFAVFNAVQKERVDLLNETARNAWMKANGVDPVKFSEAFNSFTVQTHMGQATRSAGLYDIQGVPTLIINGRYSTSPSLTQSFEGALSVTNQLIERVRAERASKK